MNLTETPEIATWPETHYVYVEKAGPFMQTAPAAWGEAHQLLQAVTEHNQISGYMSLYKTNPDIYRAGFALAAEPKSVPEGMGYEKFAGGKYSRFVLTGPYNDLPQASGRVWQLVKETNLAVRDGWAIENYVNDPRTTPAEQLVTQILVPTA